MHGGWSIGADRLTSNILDDVTVLRTNSIAFRAWLDRHARVAARAVGSTAIA
ncbi:Hypothetical protein A7982_09783 [Minicystis rosea]|nr:Hypothetical protein A7982_09783 [Minicystis rosea]